MSQNDKFFPVKTIGICITILLAALLAAFLWQMFREETDQALRSERMEEALRPLYQEKARLRQDMADLDEGQKGMGSVVFLFTTLDEIIYTDICPQMENCGFKGVLAVSAESAPGMEGCLSMQQFKELLEKGWECCLVWDDSADREIWVRANDMLLMHLGIEKPEAVYFPSDTYESELDVFLLREGFSAAVHHGEEQRDLVVTGTEDGIWHLGSMPWNRNGVRANLLNAAQESGNLVLTVGTDTRNSVYNKEEYGYMLDTVGQSCEEGSLFVTGIPGAREYQEILQDDNAARKAETEKRKAELEKQLEELDVKINDIVEKYM